MKYNYFCHQKGGKYLIRSQFWYNNLDTVYLSQSFPLFASTGKNISDGYYKLSWYYCDKDNKLQSRCCEPRQVELANARYDEMWFPEGDSILSWRHDNMTPYHQNFTQCFETLLDHHLIVNPLNMMGYCGLLGSEKMQIQLAAGEPLFHVPESIIVELRKRTSIIAYKDNIRHLAFNFFAGNGSPIHLPEAQFVERVTYIINQSRKFIAMLPQVLEKYDMPYEMFSLDSGDYNQRFNLPKALPRSTSDTIFTKPTDKTNQYVDDYMRQYEKI